MGSLAFKREETLRILNFKRNFLNLQLQQFLLMSLWWYRCGGWYWSQCYEDISFLQNCAMSHLYTIRQLDTCVLWLGHSSYKKEKSNTVSLFMLENGEA